MPLTGVARIDARLDRVQDFFSGGARRSPWADDVRRVIAELRELNRATEKDFLQVGGHLMAFLSSSRQLHSEIEALSALVSGEQAQKACEALLSVRQFVQQLQRQSEQSSQALSILQTCGDRIRRGFSGFGKIALSFRVTATFARMEAAHLASTQQNLKNLADDVRSCSESIRQHADRVLDVAAEFDERIASTLRQILRFQSIQVMELPSLMAAVDADVELFQDRQRESEEVSAALSTDRESVARELGNVAVSLQFHDITRQQIEHVIEALEEVLGDSAEGAISSRGGEIVKLQKAQLRSAAAAFARATSKAGDDLAAITARVSKMAAASRGIHRLDNKEEAGFREGVLARFASIARAVAELDALVRSARSAVVELQATSRNLGSAVAEVRSIELQLGHISINAIISSSHIGAQGEALKVIAGAIRELRTESSARTADAGTAIDAITEVLRSLAGADTSVGESSGSMLLRDLDTRVTDLQSAGEGGARAASKVAAMASRLCADLQRIREDFGIGRRFAATADRCCALLDDVAGGALLPNPAEKHSGEETRQLRYTMEVEREVHRAATGGTTHLALGALPIGNIGNQEGPGEGGGDAEFF